MARSGHVDEARVNHPGFQRFSCIANTRGKSLGVVGFQKGPARAEVRGVSLTVLGWAIA
jgi:hypothetical protein